MGQYSLYSGWIPFIVAGTIVVDAVGPQEGFSFNDFGSGFGGKGFETKFDKGDGKGFGGEQFSQFGKVGKKIFKEQLMLSNITYNN